MIMGPVLWGHYEECQRLDIEMIRTKMLTLLPSSPAFQSKETLLPGLALATRADATALLPQLTSGLLAPLIGLVSLIWRTTLCTLEGGSLGALPVKALPSMVTVATKP